MKEYYYSHGKERRNYRRAKYALRQPKPDIKQMYVKEIQKQLLQSKLARDELVGAFKSHYSSIAKSRPKLSRKVICGAASRQLLSKVLQLRKDRAGLFLKSITSIKQKITKFESEDDFGDRYHMVSSEPYFYESAYCHIRCKTVFPINEKGQLLLAACHSNSDNRGSQLTDNSHSDRSRVSGDKLTSSTKDCKKSKHSLKWKCSFLCRPLPQTEVDSIIALRQAFEKPVEQLRSVLHACDEDCPNLHFESFFVQVEQDEEDPTLTYTYYIPRDLKGHPLVCSIL